MPIQLLMPALSPTMTEGKLAKWSKKEGDAVKAGDVIAEIETDKATMEFEAVDEGTLGKILVPEGAENIAVNQPIAILLEEGEDKSALDQAPKSPVKTLEAPKAETKVASTPAPAPTPNPPPQAEEGAKISPPPRSGGGLGGGASRIFVSPLARRLAEQAKLDLRSISGTGPHGRIVQHDVEAALKGGAKRAAAPSAPFAAPAPGGGPLSKAAVYALSGNTPFTEIPMTGMRRTVAKRMVESKTTVPHFYLTIDCDIDPLMRTRSELAEAASTKLSVNDFVIKAAALALRKIPRANASYSDEAILLWSEINIAVAVALDDGLITPIIKNADTKRLSEISAEMKDLGLRARAGKLKLTEFQGGTFSISNLGMYGIKDFAAVINPPHGSILAVGAGEQRPVVKNGAIVVGTVMSCTLACDHRVVDGAVGAQYLAEFKKIIEHPSVLLL
ncbi:MAG TPA: pyruvate dehydrogenase complex dihydrolipoamide acetyltransferase [Stellaceae bacterium]|jgi:pyruvate dehydrogenase E2 component (dihydrolipoamide acetyltransferase)|nr:pyruvate dehydrogenase complex dihydrolipoamide acetyltransferase [Stellaceae bacterium]